MINWLELEAIRRALVVFRDIFQGWHLDYVQQQIGGRIHKQIGGTQSKRLFSLTKSILVWCCDHKAQLLCRHIAGHLNVKADWLSCQSQVIGTK